MKKVMSDAITEITSSARATLNKQFSELKTLNEAEYIKQIIGTDTPALKIIKENLGIYLLEKGRESISQNTETKLNFNKKHDMILALRTRTMIKAEFVKTLAEAEAVINELETGLATILVQNV